MLLLLPPSLGLKFTPPSPLGPSRATVDLELLVESDVSMASSSAREEEAAFSVQATDYRLCEAASASDLSSGLFSASWDANDPDTVYLCHSDGTLRVLNTLVEESHHYHTLFRPVSAPEGEARRVPAHWDKAITVSGRPGNVFFLLGVSRHLSFASLPASSGFGAGSFILGREVLQLWSHSTRITALSASCDGSIISTGDESGGIRLVAMSKLAPLIDGSASNRSDPSLGVLHLQAHRGSVFSMHWPDVPVEGQSGRQTLLCTGSADFSLRVWRVTLAGGRLACLCLRSIGTLSSHVLCVSSCRSGSSLLLAAGTNIGSLYLWELGDRPEETAPELHSFVHSSQFPVVQVGVAVGSSADFQILVAASDTAGSVRTHSGVLNHAAGGSERARSVELVNEAGYHSPVVACSFQPPSASHQSHRLLVCLLDRSIRLYSEEIFSKVQVVAIDSQAAKAELKFSADESADDRDSHQAPSHIASAVHGYSLPLDPEDEESDERESVDPPLRESADFEPRKSPPPRPLEVGGTVGAPAVGAPSKIKADSLAKGNIPAEASPTSSGSPENAVTVATTEQDLGARDDLKPGPPTAYLSQPSIFSSDLLRKRAGALAAKLEEDNMSLNSVETTPSEGKEAATSARSFAKSTRRYSGLTDISDAKLREMIPSRPNLGKQVEQAW